MNETRSECEGAMDRAKDGSKVTEEKREPKKTIKQLFQINQKKQEKNNPITEDNTMNNDLKYQIDQLFKKLDAVNRKLDKQIGDPENGAESAFEKINSVNSKLDEQRRVLEGQKESLDSTHSKLDEQKESLDSTHNKLDEQREVLEAQKWSVDSTHCKLDEQRGVLEGQKESLDSTHNKLDEQKESLDSTHSKLDEQKESLDSTHNKLDEQRGVLEGQKESLDSTHNKLDEQKESLDSTHSKLDDIAKRLHSVDGKLGGQIETPDTVVNKKWYESVDSKLEAQRGIVHDVRRKLDEVRRFGAMIGRIEDAQKVYEEQLEEQKKSSQAVIDALTSQLEAEKKLAKAQEEEILRLRNELDMK